MERRISREKGRKRLEVLQRSKRGLRSIKLVGCMKWVIDLREKMSFSRLWAFKYGRAIHKTRSSSEISRVECLEQESL